MGQLLILLALGLAAADKLDRTYLPPPDAKFSGGNPEDLQIPLEFPKEITSVTPTFENNGLLRSGYIGSNVKSTFTPNIDTLSTQQNYFPVTSTASYGYFPNTQKNNDGVDVKRPLNTNKRVINSNSQQGNLYTLSQDMIPVYQYPTSNVRYSEITNPSSINARKYLEQKNDSPVFTPERFDEQNQVMHRNFPDNMRIYGQDIIVPLRQNPQYTEKIISPFVSMYHINEDMPTSQYAANAKIMNNALNSYKKSEIKFDIPMLASDISPGNDTRGTAFFESSNNSSPFSPTSDTKRIFVPERHQAEADKNANILNYQNVITPEEYSYSYDTSNGISANESGTTTDGVRAKGAYSYTGDDGKVYRVVYIADENGFQPFGDHLPPIPSAIQGLIEKAAREKEAGIFDDGSYDEAKYGHKNYEGAMERYHPEFQGVSNNYRNRFSNFRRKQNNGDSIHIPVKIITKQKEYSGNSLNTYIPSDGIHHQGNNHVVLPSNYGSQTYQLDRNVIDPIKFTGDTMDTVQQEYRNRFGNQLHEKTPKAITQEGDQSQSQLMNLAVISSVYGSKQILQPNQNIPEIKVSSRAYTIKNNQDTPTGKQDGYFYVTPQNKLTENGNQMTNKNRNLFNTDQELEIGDDDIVTVSVPSPNTSMHPSHEGIQNPILSSDSITQTQGSNKSFSDFVQNNYITNKLDNGDYHKISDTKDLQKGNFESDDNFRISEPTIKPFIGEDFAGPKRPQTFDPLGGYYY